MAESGIVYDSRELDYKLGRNLEELGVSMQFVGRDLMRVLMNNVTSFTFPKNTKEGKRAIDADTSRTFAALDSREAVAFFNREFGDGSASKSGILKGKKRKAQAQDRLRGVEFNWMNDQGRMRRHHEQFRRRGRVRYSPGSIKVGNWTFERSMYVTTSAMRKFRREKYKSIGKNKAGWEPAATYFARVTKGRSTVPAFVKKQPIKRGRFKDAYTKDGNGFATATNLTPYASRMTRYFLKRAQLKTDAYSQKATRKQAEKIAERFNQLQGRAA